MIDIPQANPSEDIPHSGWRKTPSGKVFLACPVCKYVAAMDHEIAADGKVTPSVACPSCEFHEYVRLLEWKEAGRTC